MQISKRIKHGQNLVEFVFIFPILMIVTLVIFEVALFWQDVNAIYNLNSEIIANISLLDGRGHNFGSECQAASKALKILENKDKIITMSDMKYTKEILDGQEPFAYYKFSSDKTVKNKNKPIVTLWIDCRNPFEDGYMSQIEFYHKTLIISASIPSISGEAIEIIPKHVFISSPKESTLRHY